MIPRRTPLRRSTKPIRRSLIVRTRSRIRPINVKRRASEFARCYHSKARVLFVKGLPCIVCGMTPCDNAHIENGGTGRKADYTKIVPLCCMAADHPHSPGYRRGHHGLFHQIGRYSFTAQYPKLYIDFDRAAAETERKWQQHLNFMGRAA